MLQELVHGWQERLVAFVKKGNARVSGGGLRNWNRYGTEILKKIDKLDPVLRSELADVDRTLQPIAASLKTEAESILRELQERVSRMHHGICSSLEETLQETLEYAAQIRGEPLNAVDAEYFRI